MSNKENFGSPCKFENCRYRSALPYNLKKHYLNVHLKKSPPPELECTGPASDTPDEREQGIFRLEMKPQFDLECVLGASIDMLARVQLTVSLGAIL